MADTLWISLALPPDPARRQWLRTGLSSYDSFRSDERTIAARVPIAVAEFLDRLMQGQVSRAPPWEMPAPGGYHSYTSLTRDLHDLAKAWPACASVTSIGRSVEGRDIWALRIRAPNANPSKRVLLVGCHHAREWISVEIPYLIAQHILKNSETGQIGNLLRRLEIWIIPMLNPDGHIHSVNENRQWRKNRAQGSVGIGVDLNRNYPLRFREGLFDDDPRRDMYCGPSALSEPETQAMAAILSNPGFAGLVSYHAYGRQILHPWAGSMFYDPQHPTDEIANLAVDMSNASGQPPYVVLEAWRHYGLIVGGELADWAFTAFGTTSLTVELPPGADELVPGSNGFELPSRQIDPVFRQHLPAALKFLDHF